jgi:hypothetical protein
LYQLPIVRGSFDFGVFLSIRRGTMNTSLLYIIAKRKSPLDGVRVFGPQRAIARILPITEQGGTVTLGFHSMEDGRISAPFPLENTYQMSSLPARSTKMNNTFKGTAS